MWLAGWNKFTNSWAPALWQGLVFTARPGGLQIDARGNCLYHSLKWVGDVDNKNHHLLVLSICQLFSSKEEKQVETYHEFHSRVSTQICSMAQATVGPKSLFAYGVLPLLIMNSSCIRRWHFPFSGLSYFLSFFMCFQSALKTPGVCQRTPVSHGFSKRINSQMMMLTFERRNNLSVPSFWCFVHIWAFQGVGWFRQMHL